MEFNHMHQFKSGPKIVPEYLHFQLFFSVITFRSLDLSISHLHQNVNSLVHVWYSSTCDDVSGRGLWKLTWHVVRTESGSSFVGYMRWVTIVENVIIQRLCRYANYHARFPLQLIVSHTEQTYIAVVHILSRFPSN